MSPTAEVEAGRAPELVRRLLAAGETVPLRLEGGSMAPFLRPGDLVRIAPLDTGEPRVGDVVAFLAGPRLVVHRVLAVGPDRVRLRGDAAPAHDDVPRGAVAGRIVAAERAGRRLRLGLGPERRLLAWLSAHDWLHRRP